MSRPKVAEDGRPEDLTARQTRALAAVLSSPTVREAASAAGVGERTLGRWLASPVFRAALRDHARDVSSEATSRLLGARRRAVATLLAALDDESPSVRLRAAVALLEHGDRAREDDIEVRLTELERRVNGWQPTDGAGLNGWPVWSPDATVSR